MRKITLLCLSLLAISSSFAQKKDFSYNFYGFVRGDLFYNSRANVEGVNGTFFLYPMDIEEDTQGEDLNAVANGSFYTFTTRLGLDIQGPNLGSARTAVKIETDFGGFGASPTMLRIRQAYVALNWEKDQLLIGQTWHPLFGEVSPDILNLSSGAPFNPFNRSPMIRYQHQFGQLKLTAATVWQLQSLSSGPNGASAEYIKNSMVPEIYVGLDWKTDNGWQAGINANLVSLKPYSRDQIYDPSTMTFSTYKIDGRMTALTYGAYVRYAEQNFSFAAKSFLASGIDNSSVLGGYGMSKMDTANGEYEYSPFRHSLSWMNLTVGSTWKGGLFLAYAKNLGTSDELTSPLVYGKGLNIDQLYSVNPNFSYNKGNWKIGIEYCLRTAYYGTIDLKDGQVRDTHSVTNHRLLGLLVYNF